MFDAFQCKRGYEVARQNAKKAKTPEEKEKWERTALKWLSRWANNG
jgi:hypothetical protein